MKIRTYAEACEVQAIIRSNKERVVALENLVKDAESKFSTMTNAQLSEAIRDIMGMRRECDSLKKYIAKATDAVNEYIAPAFHVSRTA